MHRFFRSMTTLAVISVLLVGCGSDRNPHDHNSPVLTGGEQQACGVFILQGAGFEAKDYSNEPAPPVIRVHLTGPDGNTSVITPSAVTGSATSESVTVSVPVDAPDGNYTAQVVTKFSNGDVEQSKKVTVTKNCALTTPVTNPGQLITTSTTGISITHSIANTKCPTPMGTVNVTNNSSTESITLTVTADSTQVDVSPSQTTIAPGATVPIQVQFNCQCGPCSTFSTTVSFAAVTTDGLNSDSEKVQGTVTIEP